MRWFTFVKNFTENALEIDRLAGPQSPPLPTGRLTASAPLDPQLNMERTEEALKGGSRHEGKGESAEGDSGVARNMREGARAQWRNEGL